MAEQKLQLKGPGGEQQNIDQMKGADEPKKPQDLVTSGINLGTQKLSEIAKQLIKDKDLSQAAQDLVQDTGRSLHSLHKDRIDAQNLQNMKKPTTNESVQNKKKPGFFQRVGGFFKNLWGKLKAPVSKFLPSVANAGVKFLQSKLLQ